MRKLIFLFLIPSFACSQRNYTVELNNYLDAQLKVKSFNGSILVMQKNQVVLQKAYGLADREWNISNTVDTKFRIGSITKQFTAAGILQLVEQQKISLDDRLSKFIPDFPKGDSVTIHMLLNHTSGIPSFTDQKDFDQVARQSFSKDSIVNWFKNRPYNFSPGTKWAYNNSGYFLLGYILEKISGQSYESYLRTHIFDKLGMNNTGSNNLDSILLFRAKGYGKGTNGFINASFISMEWPFSAGVLYSTTTDLYKWDRALYTNTILTESSRKKMFTPGKSNYGYGIIIDSFENHPRIWHNGGIPGFVSNFSRFPKDDICIIVLSNNESNSDQVAAGIADILFDVPVELPYEHKEITLDPAQLDKFVGKYNAFLTIEVIKKDGKLFRHREGTPDILLKPESPVKFFYSDGSDRQLEFELDSSGKVIRIWFINNGQRGEMKKQ